MVLCAGLKDGGSHEPENAALGAGKGKEVGSPLEPRREHGTALGKATEAHFYTSDIQNCKKINTCCWKAQSVSFVTAAGGN